MTVLSPDSSSAPPGRNLPGQNQPKRRKPVPLRRVLLMALLVIISLVFLFPFLLIARYALSTDADISSLSPLAFLSPIQFGNFSELLGNTDANIGLGLRNSAIIAVLQTVFVTVFASLAGFGFAQVPFGRRNLVFGVVLLTMTIPPVALFIPQYVLVSSLGWVNTLQGIVLPGLFSAFATFVFRQFYLDFPRELSEAGRLDGLNYFGIYRYLALPNSTGIIMALGILSFIGSWNAFLWPLVIGQDPHLWTVQVGVSSLITAQTVVYHQVFMAALLSVLPLLILFLFFQRWITEGVKLTGSKG